MTISWPNPRKFCRDRALGIILEEYCTYPIARSWLVGNDSPSTSLPSRFSRRSRDRTFLVVTARIKWGGLPSSIFSAPKANWKGFVGGFGSFTADRYLYAGLCVARDHSIRLFSTRHSAARKWDFLCIAFYADNFPTLRLCQSREAHWKPSACVVIAKSRTHWYLRIDLGNCWEAVANGQTCKYHWQGTWMNLFPMLSRFQSSWRATKLLIIILLWYRRKEI